MENKSYNTIQKQRILEMLKANSNHHLNVDEMLFILNTKQIYVSRATLYRYLDVLVQTGEVRKFLIGDNEKACYQYIEDKEHCSNHFHLMCTECGKLIHLHCQKVDDIVGHILEEHKFLVDPGRVVFYGICEECQKKEGIINA